MARMRDENDSYLKPGMKDENDSYLKRSAETKKKLGSMRPMTGGQGQIDRGDKALKKAGYNVLYDSKKNSSERLRDVKMALKAYNVKAKNVKPADYVPPRGGKVGK